MSLLLQVKEFDVAHQAYTEWSESCGKKFPQQWLEQGGNLCSISYLPSSPAKLLMVSQHHLMLVDMSQVI